LRIAIDARLVGGTSTGDSTYWTELCIALVRRFPEVKLLLLTDQIDRLPAELRELGILVTARHPRLWSLFAFPRACRTHKADVAHVQYNISPFMPCPTVTTIHDVSFFIGPEWFSARDRFVLQRFIPATVRRAKAIITVSQTSKKEIEHNLPGAKGKTVGILNGPNALIHHVVLDEAWAIARNLGITRPFLMTLGTVWPRKNMMLAVNAWQELRKTLEIDLVVVGKQGPSILPEIQGLHRTGYLEWNQVSALYSSASAYLCPSLHEGFGLPILEAWQCNCPVIATPLGAIPEVAGDGALIIDSLDPKIWAAQIQSLLQDSGKLDEIKRRGATRLSQFSWNLAAEQTMSVYKRANG
jgi:glycosyltransferase involved in cell wall biosynthesis